MAIGDHNKYLPIRLEIIRIRRYNKRYIAPADAGEAWKKGRNMKKSIRGILLLAACTVFFAGCARSKGSWEAFTENTLYVAGDGSVSWASVESFGEGDYKEEELKAFAGERISQFNQSQGEEPAFENEKGAEKLPVALDTVSMKDGRAVLVTEYDTPSRLVEFSQDIGDGGMPFDSIDIGSPASLALKEQTSYLDIEGKAVDQQEILKETGLAVRVSGQGVISAEKKIRYISEGCTLRDVHTVETASEGVSCIILE